jgi:hypothetical protein
MKKETPYRLIADLQARAKVTPTPIPNSKFYQKNQPVELVQYQARQRA